MSVGYSRDRVLLAFYPYPHIRVSVSLPCDPWQCPLDKYRMETIRNTIEKVKDLEKTLVEADLELLSAVIDIDGEPSINTLLISDGDAWYFVKEKGIVMFRDAIDSDLPYLERCFERMNQFNLLENKHHERLMKKIKAFPYILKVKRVSREFDLSPLINNIVPRIDINIPMKYVEPLKSVAIARDWVLLKIREHEQRIRFDRLNLEIVYPRSTLWGERRKIRAIVDKIREYEKPEVISAIQRNQVEIYIGLQYEQIVVFRRKLKIFDLKIKRSIGYEHYFDVLFDLLLGLSPIDSLLRKQRTDIKTLNNYIIYQ